MDQYSDDEDTDSGNVYASNGHRVVIPQPLLQQRGKSVHSHKYVPPKDKTWICPICSECFAPYMPSCGHSICVNCKDKVQECPICRNPSKTYSPNYDLGNALGLEMPPIVKDVNKIPSIQEIKDSLTTILSAPYDKFDKIADVYALFLLFKIEQLPVTFVPVLFATIEYTYDEFDTFAKNRGQELPSMVRDNMHMLFYTFRWVAIKDCFHYCTSIDHYKCEFVRVPNTPQNMHTIRANRRNYGQTV